MTRERNTRLLQFQAQAFLVKRSEQTRSHGAIHFNRQTNDIFGQCAMFQHDKPRAPPWFSAPSVLKTFAAPPAHTDFPARHACRHARDQEEPVVSGSSESATAFLVEAGRSFMPRMNADSARQMLLDAIKGHCPSMIP